MYKKRMDVALKWIWLKETNSVVSENEREGSKVKSFIKAPALSH